MSVALFAWMLEHFTEERYLAMLKVGGMICAFGDMAAVLCLLLVVGEVTGRRPTKRMIVLGLCLAASTAQLLPNDANFFFVAMFAVFAVPYLIMVGTAATTMPAIIAKMHEIAHTRRQKIKE